jgi:copper resistance protein C
MFRPVLSGLTDRKKMNPLPHRGRGQGEGDASANSAPTEALRHPPHPALSSLKGGEGSNWNGFATRAFPIAAAALFALAAQPAAAHAFLDHAQPGVGSTLAAAPAQIKIWFTEALEPAFSTIAVTDAGGGDVGQGKTKVDAADPKLLELGLKTLAPGTYRVKWRAISVDTHQTEGDYTFTVKP